MQDFSGYLCAIPFVVAGWEGRRQL